MGISYKGGKLMAKIYYGDENNTAVELNIGVSQEYVDSQIEAVSGDIHSIPAGGTTGQVLSKVDGTDYNTVWADPSGGSDPDAIKKDGTTRTTAQIPFVFGTNSTKYRLMEYPGVITSPGYSGLPDRTIIGVSKVESGGGVPAHTSISIGTSDTVNETGYTEMDINAGNLIITINGERGAEGQVLTANAYGYCEWADPTGSGGGLNYTPDVWTFSIPSSQGTSPYAYYYTESADTPQYRKTNATFETISEHWCKLKLFFEVDCEEEKNAWPSLSPNIQAIVNAQSSTILNHYPGKSINNSYSSPIYYWGGYMDTGSSGESSVKTVESDTFTISELNGTDENAAVGWQIPDSIIPTGTNFIITFGTWEYWVRLD